MIAAQTARGKKALIPRGWMNAAGELKAFAYVGVRDGTGNRDVWDVTVPSPGVGSLTVTAEPGVVEGYAARVDEIFITTETTFASVTGAVGAVSWAWEQIGGDPGWTITRPDRANTAFAVVNPGGLVGATFRVTATDSLGRTGAADVLATTINFGWSGF